MLAKILVQIISDKNDDHRQLVTVILSEIKLIFTEKEVLPITREYIKIPEVDQNEVTSTTVSTFFLVNFDVPIPIMLHMMKMFQKSLLDEKFHKHVCSVSKSCFQYLKDDSKKGS